VRHLRVLTPLQSTLIIVVVVVVVVDVVVLFIASMQGIYNYIPE
jgi:hypothetical protein